MRGDSSSCVENSAVVAGGHGRGGGHEHGHGAIQKGDVDAEKKVYTIMLTVVETIIHLIII